MEINEVKVGDTVTFTHNKKKVTGKVIYRHDSVDNKKAERAALMGHVNVQVMDNKSYPVTVHVSKLKPAIQEETTMEEMNENVLDLIDRIDSGDNLEAEKLLNDILSTRVTEVLDAVKIEVASSMFNTEECADCDAEVNEALKGGQHKIDANKNGKVDAHDFKLLRGRKTAKSERMDRALAKRVENNKKSMKEEAEQVDESLAGLAGLAIGAWRGAKGAQRAAKNTGNKGAGEYFKQFAKGAAGLPDERAKKKKMKEEVEQVDEASYSAKAAAAGKKGKMFGKIAKKASRKYGKERGAKIAGAVLAKLRKKGK